MCICGYERCLYDNFQKGLEDEIIKYLQQRAKSQAEDESDPLKGQRDNMSYSNAINKASEAYIQRYR